MTHLRQNIIVTCNISCIFIGSLVNNLRTNPDSAMGNINGSGDGEDPPEDKPIELPHR